MPYIYSTEGKIKEPNLAAEAGQGLLGAVSSYRRGGASAPRHRGIVDKPGQDMMGVFKGISGLAGMATGSNKKANDLAKRTKTSPADVVR